MKDPTPKVSVLMPCYNAAATLDEALDSLSGQSLRNYQVVAVDDGSSDGTLEKLHQRARADARVCVMAQSHQGIIAALNAGLEACQAEVVARMDADDRAHPQRLEKQLAFLEAYPDVALVGCCVSGFPPEQVRQGFRVYLEWQNALLSEADIRREMFVESPLAHPSVMFRRRWVADLGGYLDNGWAEDYDLWLRLYLAGAHFAKLPETLLEWRESPDRLTRRDERYSLENFLRAKAYYLRRGPLNERDAVIVWGAGMIGRRLSKHLLRQDVPLVAFIDIDPRKIGRLRRGLPILPPDELPALWQRYNKPAILAAVGARGARGLIRKHLNALKLCEGRDWWGVA